MRINDGTLGRMTKKRLQLLATILLGLAWVFASVALERERGAQQLPVGTESPPAPPALVHVKRAQGGDDAAASSIPLQASSAGASLYPVVHVVDGDTIDVLKDGAKVRVRLIGINAPESVDPRRPVQCFGKEASAAMKALVEGQSVALETDPSQDTYDKYGRLLAYVYLGRPGLPQEDVALALIAGGYAHEYTYRLPYAHQAAYKAAQTEARSAGRGLWAADACENQVQ